MKYLSPEVLLFAYQQGLFPMAEGRNAKQIQWIQPEKRGIFQLGNFHISKSLRRVILKKDYSITINSCFPKVMEKCADRSETWINDDIYNCYCKLHEDGFAHSVEVWRNSHLIGGVYGVTIGAAFFGESMFSEAANGSKIALAYLHDRLLKAGFLLFDTQFLTEHLASLGAIEISQAQYLVKLEKALNKNATFLDINYSSDVETIAHRSTHRS
ncbi:MAG: leucyl/phenylalanyl-tRNA--protein transferase [Paracoccaceae bacterium]|nr:leucyl/phenylalanyl-tRNA--protein transferase [Paracoccaceae bacterium]MDG2248939.1 leucyl/phenylalanyl-tRNA--protein transferase [Paracoccaceae bacterium]